MNCSVEIAFRTFDIWENIFKYFDLKEQLRLTRVCDLFLNVITSLMWKRNCKELKLYVINAANIIVTDRVDNIGKYYSYAEPMYRLGYKDCRNLNASNRTSVIFDYDEVLEFLSMNLNNIKKLQIIDEYNINLLGFVTENKCEELTTLILCEINELNADHLKNINLTCPLLNTLILKCNKNKNAILQDGITALTNMSMLKTLIVNEKEFTYTFNHILSVITNLKDLQEIVLNVNIVPNGTDISSEMNSLNQKGSLCQLLKIVLPHMSPQILATSLLKNFEHLQALTMTSNYSSFTINQQFLENLIKSCRHLKNLYMEFCSFEKFVAMPSLETLTFVNCNGMNWWSLKSILNQTNLRSFTTVFTKFSDNFEQFYIESPLEYLHIETVEYEYRREFAQLLIYNQQRMNLLRTLIWHYPTLWYLDEPIIILPLKDTYHNLHSLQIDLGVFDLVDLMEMKALKQLHLIGDENAIDLSDLLNILNHSTLESLTVYNRNLKCCTKSYVNDLINFTTNLRLIEIPLDVFNKNTNIWFKLLSANRSLQLVCYFYEDNFIDFEYLNGLIENDHFPTRIQSIEIGDFTIDCNNLKENAASVKTMILTAKHYCKRIKETMYVKF